MNVLYPLKSLNFYKYISKHLIFRSRYIDIYIDIKYIMSIDKDLSFYKHILKEFIIKNKLLGEVVNTGFSPIHPDR